MLAVNVIIAITSLADCGNKIVCSVEIMKPGLIFVILSISFELLYMDDDPYDVAAKLAHTTSPTTHHCAFTANFFKFPV